MIMVTVGTPAPEFELQDQEGRTVSRSDFLGRPLVLYFYPKDGSEACTRQACGLRDHWSELASFDVAIIGVSPDGVDAHRSFAAANNLPQQLLADPDLVAIERYGVWGEKVVRGTVKQGVIRSTFLVDSDGVIIDQWRNVDPDAHVQDVLEALKETQDNGAAPA